MKKHLLSLLAAVLMVPWVASAQSTLTVAEGTATSGNVPIYGYWVDTYQRNQMIYPAWMLEDMLGGLVTNVEWYLSSTATSAWGIQVEVWMAEVDDSVIATASQFIEGDLEQVWSGVVNGTQNVWAIELDEPYTYQGGNLLVDVRVVGTGTFSSASFAGISRTGGSMYTYNNGTAYVSSFLPKCTFTYTEGGSVCRKPSGFAATQVETNSASLIWNGQGYESATYVLSMNGEVVAEDITDTVYVADNLSHSTVYTFGVRRVCDDGDSSRFATITVNTPCQPIDELPYLKDFEDGSLHCWNVSNEDYVWVYNDASFAYMGDRFLIFYTPSSTPATNYTAITPQMEIPELADGTVFSWAVSGNGSYLSSQPCTYEVRISTNASTTLDDSFETVLLDSLYQTNTWNPRQIDLSEYAGQTITIAIVHTTDNAQTGVFLMVDNVSLRNPYAPVARVGRYSQKAFSSMSSVMVTEDATFEAWLEDGSEDNLSFTWQSAMADAGNAVLSANDGNVNIVYSVAGIDTLTLVATNSYGSSTVVLPVYVNEFSLASLPFNCGFDSQAEMSDWTVFALDSSANSMWKLYTGSYSGTYAIGSRGLNDERHADVMLVSPAIAVPENVAHMEMTYYVAGYCQEGEEVTYDVVVSNSGRSSYQYFADTLLHDTVTDNEYNIRRVLLNGYAGDTVYIAFRHTSSHRGTLVFDQLEIRETAEPVIYLDAPGVAFVDSLTNYSVVFTEGISEGANYTWTSAKVAAGSATVQASTADSIFTVIYTEAGFDTVKVVVDNGYGADSATVVVRVRSLGNVAQLPFNEDFEGDDVEANWEINTYGTNAWHIGSLAGTSTGLYVSSNGGTTYGYAESSTSFSTASRFVNFEQAAEYAVTYDWKAEAEHNYDYIRVFLAPKSMDLSTMTSIDYGSLPSGCIALDGGDQLNLESEWQNYIGTFIVPQAGIYQFVVAWRNDGSVGYDPAGAIDNVGISTLTCPSPTALTLTDVDETSLSFSWTAGGEEAAWEVTVGDADPVEVSEPSYTATALSPSTFYTVKVRALCGDDDNSLYVTASFMTSCGTITELPWSEPFNSNDAAACWSTYDNDGNTSTDWQFQSDYEGGGYMVSYFNDQAEADDWLVTPAVALPADADSLQLGWRAFGSTYQSTYSTHITVLLSTSGIAMANFTDTLYAATLPDDWSNLAVSLNAYAGETVRIAFVHDSYNDDELRIDDVTIVNGELAYTPDTIIPVPTECAAPVLAQPTTTENSVSISWTGSADSYEVAIAEGSWTAPAQPTAVSTTSHTFTGLQAATQYTVGVRAVCDDGEYSNWVTRSVTTAQSSDPGDDTTTTAVRSVESLGFGLYPNPASTSVRLDLGSVEAQQVAVIDQSGRIVMQLSNLSGTTDIDLSSMPKGAYYVRVVTATEAAVRKLIVR